VVFFVIDHTFEKKHAKMAVLVHIRDIVEGICIRSENSTLERKQHILRLVYAARACLDPDRCNRNVYDEQLERLLESDTFSTDSFCRVLTPLLSDFEFPFSGRGAEAALHQYGLTMDDLSRLDSMTDKDEMLDYLMYLTEIARVNMSNESYRIFEEKSEKRWNFAKLIGFIFATAVIYKDPSFVVQTGELGPMKNETTSTFHIPRESKEETQEETHEAHTQEEVHRKYNAPNAPKEWTYIGRFKSPAPNYTPENYYRWYNSDGTYDEWKLPNAKPTSTSHQTPSAERTTKPTTEPTTKPTTKPSTKSAKSQPADDLPLTRTQWNAVRTRSDCTFCGCCEEYLWYLTEFFRVDSDTIKEIKVMQEPKNRMKRLKRLLSIYLHPDKTKTQTLVKQQHLQSILVDVQSGCVDVCSK
jgi:hypothetical protein